MNSLTKSSQSVYRRFDNLHKIFQEERRRRKNVRPQRTGSENVPENGDRTLPDMPREGEKEHRKIPKKALYTALKI
ncbi:MAG: hypothetical protein LUG47_02140 [Clostridiales bacterium]|nr:hypothetical protein [Clostridiales bacterium]